MQPVLSVLSDIPGAVYVNGRLAGETDGERAVSLPVSLCGALLLEHRPFGARYLPTARRFALSGGRPVAASIESGPGLSVVAWPCGVVEAEFHPRELPEAPLFVHELPEPILGARARWACGEGGWRVEFSRDGSIARHDVPGPPEIRAWNGRVLITGATEAGERYARVLSPDLRRATLSLRGREAGLSEGDALRALVDLGDTVGHARLELWALDGAAPLASEMFWSDGTPRWPRTPQDTALAAVEAAQLRLTDEAEAYLTPALARKAGPLWEHVYGYEAATKLKYPLPDGRQAVGLVRLAAENYAAVEPLYYHALPSGGQQGAWRLDRLAFE